MHNDSDIQSILYKNLEKLKAPRYGALVTKGINKNINSQCVSKRRKSIKKFIRRVRRLFFPSFSNVRIMSSDHNQPSFSVFKSAKINFLTIFTKFGCLWFINRPKTDIRYLNNLGNIKKLMPYWMGCRNVYQKIMFIRQYKPDLTLPLVPTFRSPKIICPDKSAFFQVFPKIGYLIF